jgi:drug/metabolite transporter (DMT)-like permease
MDMRAETPEQSAPSWMVWAALWTVYIVWGSTYLAIRITVETLPPLVTGGVRFILAGLIMAAFLRLKRGRGGFTFSAKELGAAAFVGTALIVGGNGLVMVAEQYVPSGVASLLIATVPLWVILFRTLVGDRVPAGTLGGVVLGFAGVALLVLPGDRPESAPIGGMLLLILAAFFWAGGTFWSRRVSLPRDPFTSTSLQMATGGVVSLVAGSLRGELSGIDPSTFSTRSLLAVLYLVVVGSLFAFTAYVWLLQHAPVSKVATYAYVNPVIAVFLGWLVLSEELTAFVIGGAAVIVSSVAFIVRKEAGGAGTEQEDVHPPVPAEARAG